MSDEPKPTIIATDVEMSPTIGKWAGAVAAAQAEMENATKDGDNPHFNSSFATLASITDAVKGPLSKHGIARHQAPVSKGDLTGLRTMLAHSSGEYVAATVWCKADRPGAQALGSVITYLRRYSLAAACGVAQEDDDGEAAEGRSDVGKARRTGPPKANGGPSTSQRSSIQAGATNAGAQSSGASAPDPKGNGAGPSASPPSSRSAPRAASGGRAPANSTSGDDPLEELRRIWTRPKLDDKGQPQGLASNLTAYAAWMSETFAAKDRKSLTPQQITDAYALTYAKVQGEAAYQAQRAALWALGRHYGPEMNDLPEAMGGAPDPKPPETDDSGPAAA